MIVDIPNGMAVGHVTVRIGGALSWPDDINTGKGLVAIDDTLWSARLQLVPISVKHTLGQGLRVEQRNNVGCHEGVEEMVELATPASVLECGQQPRLVLDQRIIYVDFR
jgi:hypothetical protein